MEKGKVKFFNEAKGYGFITSTRYDEIFVHVTGLIDEIHENDLVTFDVERDKKGPYAINVKVIN